MRRFGLVLVLLLGFFRSEAQAVCYGSGKDEFTTVGPSAEYLRYRARKGSARTQSGVIEVDYEGFTPEAQAAFQQAVDIWESILTTPIKIRIRARWIPLATGVLGSASPGKYVYDFDNAPMRSVWYPVALAEKIAGKELNDPSEYDIEAAFNSTQTSWHFGLLGNDPPQGKYDLASIVLHEIGHGLGITHGYDVVGTQAVIPIYFADKPVVYETNIQASSGANFVFAFTPPSTQLKSVITSKALFFSSNLVKSVNSNSNAVLYAPSTYVSGSSIAHLDEVTYPAGNPNSLMTPAIGMAERMLDPGPIALAILKEIGWSFTTLEHTPFKNTEDTSGPYHLVVKVKSDAGYFSNTVNLSYTSGNPSPTVVTMTPTGNPDEYSFDLPGILGEYDYSISVMDKDARTFTIPGPRIEPGRSPLVGQFPFITGPDNLKPVISHIPKEFAANIDDYVIDASVYDNIGVDTVTLEWQVNGVAEPTLPLVFQPGKDWNYRAIIDTRNFQIGDTIEYRIHAIDSSIAANESYFPSATGFEKAIVTGFSEPIDSYTNDFNDLSTKDFFGDGFMMLNDQVFNGRIQSMPTPYPIGGAVGAHVDLIYNFKYPVRVATEEATVKFDEIVMVEPGEDGAAWPSEDFYDYVVVEGSLDGGVTWTAIADGYDCNYNSVWRDLWDNTFNGENSTGVPNPSMYRSHVFNLLDKFHAGDEVALRFRLYSDPFAAGYGWSIDNLKIQIDETPPTIRHQHYDYVMSGTSSLTLNMEIKDFHGLDSVFVDYRVNNGSTTSVEIIVNPASNMYSSVVDLSALGLNTGDNFQYRIRAIDSLGNAGTFPADGFIRTVVLSFASPLNDIVDNFSSTNVKLTGNFFSTTDGTMSTDHPYEAGLDIDAVSDFTFITKQPIKVSALNPRMYYTDIALVEYSGSGVKDYVVVEATKDGVTWQPLIEPYAANAFADWQALYDAGEDPNVLTKYQQHQFDITANGNFKVDDVILVRFRLHSDSLKTGWGWSVDDISIQGAVTGLEPQIANEIVSAWPNPVAGGSLYLKLALPQASDVNVEIFNMQGQRLSADQFSAPSGESQHEYEVSNWPSGFYLVKVKSVAGTSVTKLIKLR